MEAILFDPLPANLFQLLFVAIVGGAIGWFIAVARHYDKVDEVVCQLHATDTTAPAVGVVLDALQNLFIEHRRLMWRHAVLRGTPRETSMSLPSTVSLARAYNTLRAHGRTPSTAQWPADMRERDEQAERPDADQPLRSAAQ